MTFEQWFKINYTFGEIPNDELTPMELVVKIGCELAWKAAKEYSKPVADVFYVDYDCRGFAQNGYRPYWTVRNTCATVIKQTKEDCIRWAIENGFRVDEGL